MKQRLLLTVAVMIAAWVVAPVALAAERFDGDWKVTLTTTGGRCLKY